jgi:RNA polymerase sigma-70 factor, ECF subfamily
MGDGLDIAMGRAGGDMNGHEAAAVQAEGRGGVLSREEFAERFRSSSRALWCIAASVSRDRSSAEDAVQEAAVIAMGKIEEFDRDTNFLAWMGQIVRFVATNVGRTSARRERILRTGVAAERHAERDEGDWGLPPGLTAALSTLEPTARACLLMRVVGEMSYQQISAALGIPEGTAMSHVFRARKSLASRLTPPAKGEA